MNKDKINFELNGQKVSAFTNETIWEVSERLGETIPHLCFSPKESYRPDGNCRACMVEIEGERVLAASCIRKPSENMKVFTNSNKATKSRSLVLELLDSDQPTEVIHDPNSHFQEINNQTKINGNRFLSKSSPEPDSSHPAIAVNLDACIQCGLCVRACREVQVNDVIGFSGRGSETKIVFDFDDNLGESTCVGCGECVQACPTGALMPKTVLDENQNFKFEPDRKVDSICPYCGVGCQLTYNIKDDKIISVSGRPGPANKSRLCVKGRYGFDYISSSERLTKPLIRLESSLKNSNNKFDAEYILSNFREASWDEALDYASKKLRSLKNTYGPNSLAGFGSAKGSNEEAYLFQKLIRTAFKTNNVDHCTRLCHASSVAALLENIGSGAVTAPFSEAKNAEVIWVIGANPSVNHPVAATFIKNAAKNGTKLFILDPRGQALDRYAQDSINFLPGSDVSLLNGVIHTIINENLYNKEYVEKQTIGFEDLKKSTQNYSPENMEKICGISAKRIRNLAREYAKSKSIIFWGMGISQHTHGTDNARCLISLALLTGNIGLPGTGLHPLRGQNNVQGASDAGLIPMFYPDYKSVEGDHGTTMSDYWHTELDNKKGLTVVEIINAAYDGELKGLYIMGENPAMSDPDQNHARAALANLDFLVVQDIFPTETSSYADVILPASAWPEKDGTVTNTDRKVQIGRKAVPMPGESKQDWWIIKELGVRMGLNWNYDSPKEIFNEMKDVMPSLNGITWERLEKENSVTYPCKDEFSEGSELLFKDGFPTPNGKGKMTSTSILPPDEKINDEFPLVLTTGRLLEHWHTGSMTRRSVVLDAIEPIPEVHVSPAQLKNVGVQPGDLVYVKTRRGQIKLSVRVDKTLQNNVIFIPFCFNEASANILTNSALDPYGKIPELKYCAARIETSA